MNRRFLNVFLAISAASVALFMSVGFAAGWSEPKIFNVLAEDANETQASETDTQEVVSETEKIDDVVEVPVPQEGSPWQPPNYSGQTGALGWSETAFDVPPELRPRVDFWKTIYTKYSTDEGIIHDSLHVSLIYDHVDFRPIMKDPNLTERQKRKKRRELVENKKKEIKARLERLTKSGANPADPEDAKFVNLFSQIDEPNKYIEATKRKRIRFQLGQNDKFRLGIFYSGKYLREMEKIFREQGLPIEITRLPFVESSFNVNAKSRVGASGIWQFMRYTGKKFMRVHYAADERNDPLRATRAAARMMRINYEMLGKWPLAITGYNHGPVGVQRMVKKFGTDNISELVDERHGRFGFASANFYSCFVAALEVEKEASKYFGAVVWDKPLDAQEIVLDRRLGKTQLLKWFGGDLEAAKTMNQHLQRPFWLGYTSLNAKDFVRVPSNQYTQALEDLKKEPIREVATSDETQFYMIGQGETLSEISVQLGVSVRAIMDMNGIDNPRSIRAGQKIMIPDKRKN